MAVEDTWTLADGKTPAARYGRGKRYRVRTTCATPPRRWRIASGANVKAVQAMLGHGSAKMTLDRYGHLFDRSLNDVGKAMGDLVSRYRSGTTGSHEAAG